MMTDSLNGYINYRKDNGFTLIELILVILILGIIAGVAVPSIRGIMDETLLDEAAQEVVNALRYARNLAIQDNTTRLVDLDPDQETCTLLLGYQSSGNNLLTFDNVLNPPGNDNWGVRNVKVSNGKTVIFQDDNDYLYNPGVDKKDYNFN
ncbi:MAG TPA: type II secretion system protein GspH, partial [Nitrospiraceae bacterium]|nr:type II secretion system protein GspH [Nitrospiraceae bacterium]